jgi:hypothetical protein
MFLKKYLIIILLGLAPFTFSANNPFKEDNSPYKPTEDDYFSKVVKNNKKNFSRWGFNFSPGTALNFNSVRSGAINSISGGMYFWEPPVSKNLNLFGGISHTWRFLGQFASIIDTEKELVIYQTTVSAFEFQSNFTPFTIFPIFQQQFLFWGIGPLIFQYISDSAEDSAFFFGQKIFFGIENHIVKNLITLNLEVQGIGKYSLSGLGLSPSNEDTAQIYGYHAINLGPIDNLKLDILLRMSLTIYLF